MVRSLVMVVKVGGQWSRKKRKNQGVAILSFNAADYDPADQDHIEEFSQSIASLIPSIKNPNPEKANQYMRNFGKNGLVHHTWIPIENSLKLVSHLDKYGSSESNAEALNTV